MRPLTPPSAHMHNDQLRQSGGVYNLTISHVYRFVWFRVAKVGTRTILEHFRVSRVPLDVEHGMRMSYDPQAFADYFKFAFVRDPFERLVSCWSNKVRSENYFGFSAAALQQMQDFNQFLSWVEMQDLDDGDHHLRKQQRLIDLNHIDLLGRTERFDDDFHRVCETLGVACPQVSRKNASAPLMGLDLLRHKNIDRVYRLYETDFELFGYRKDNAARDEARSGTCSEY
jgi:hypothetical protein